MLLTNVIGVVRGRVGQGRRTDGKMCRRTDGKIDGKIGRKTNRRLVLDERQAVEKKNLAF